MTEIIISLLAIYILIKAIKLTFKIGWGITKIIAYILISISIALFVACLFFAGGLLLLIPVALLLAVFGALKIFC